jgi:uncharacterized protein with von Willebrand factor type A (vWA) domain
MRTFRYTRWDGSQELDLFTAEDVMEKISEEMLEDGSLRSALRRMMQHGADFSSGRRMMGLQELLEKLRDARSRNLDRYNLGSILDDITERLDKIIDTERGSIKRRIGEDDEEDTAAPPQGGRGQDAPSGAQQSPSGQQGQRDAGQQSAGMQSAGQQSAGMQSGQQAAGQQAGGQQSPGQQGAGQEGGEGGQSGQDGPAPGSTDPMFKEIFEGMARRHLEQLDHLPPDVGGRINQLREYDFMDPAAREQFQELLNMLQQQVMQSYFKGLQQGLQSMTPEAMRQMHEMVKDLNDLLEKHRRGEDTEGEFEDFMKKWGQFFPDDIKNVDDLAQHLQQQIQQMESLLNSMTPEMREQLEDMVNAIFQDGDFQQEMSRLAANLDRMNPMGGAPNDFPFSGDEPVTLQEAMRLMGDMNRLDELEREFMQAIRSNDVSNIDSDEIGRLLGEEARQMTEQMQQITRMLEEAGLIRRKGNDWELTPKAVRKIGERALNDIFGALKSATFGDHTIEQSGLGMERLHETKPYQYGDPFMVDVTRSVMNAVTRGGTGMPIRLKQDDFEIYRTETLTQCSTVIMLDMSYSMMMAGRFQAGRKVALALDSLIRSQFPKDTLYVVAFSYFVLTLKPEMLLDSYWVEYGGGTNFQEALRQARMILNKHKAGTRQIIMITDGQPTTFSSWSGDDSWDGYGYRRSPRALEETLREVVRCTKDGITINTFMMERDRYLTDFVAMMARLNHGRAFYSSPSKLGEYILLDYVNNKKKVVR